MSDELDRCEQIDQWLLGERSGDLPAELSEHVTACKGCHEQVRVHQSLVAAFSDGDIPQLSADFDSVLEKKLAATRIEVRPLAGWRWAVMIGYAVAAVGILGWALKDVPVPTIDPSAPWVPVALFLAVPLTLLLAVAASRWLPAPTLEGQHRALAL